MTTSWKNRLGIGSSTALQYSSDPDQNSCETDTRGVEIENPVPIRGRFDRWSVMVRRPYTNQETQRKAGLQPGIEKADASQCTFSWLCSWRDNDLTVWYVIDRTNADICHRSSMAHNASCFIQRSAMEWLARAGVFICVGPFSASTWKGILFWNPGSILVEAFISTSF